MVRGPSGLRPTYDASSGGTLFPVLGRADLEELSGFGAERTVEPGEVLYRAGRGAADFFVVLDGEVAVVRPELEAEEVVVAYGPGQFPGDLWLVTGQHPYLTARATQPGRVLAISRDEFLRLMTSRPTIADVIFGAFVARRETLRDGSVARAIRIIGSRYSPEALALRAFASRNRLAYSWVDLEEADDVGVLLAGMGLRTTDTPVVVTTSEVLRRPTPGEFADALGLTYRPVPGRTFDLVVVGAGPGGLAGAVYGASEGLDTVTLDAAGPGGQAGASSRIENYAGFPNGVSGSDLTARTAIQAQRLGAWLVSPCEAAGLRVADGFHVVSLVDESEIPCRAVLIATGARYRRLDVPGLEGYEGRGVYYAATDLEARSCSGSAVVVVGGGNSAGQAAVYLSQHSCSVSVVVRRPDLASTMSRYLVDRIEADPRIRVLGETEVRALAGDGHLDRVTVEHNPTGRLQTVDCASLFCFIGADPATGWLGDAVALDEKGFVLTDRSLPTGCRTEHAFAGRDPLPFETSVPGVFAVGDVRSGSMKRVASAVGEGSSAVRAVHEYLASLG